MSFSHSLLSSLLHIAEGGREARMKHRTRLVARVELRRKRERYFKNVVHAHSGIRGGGSWQVYFNWPILLSPPLRPDLRTRKSGLGDLARPCATLGGRLGAGIPPVSFFHDYFHRARVREETPFMASFAQSVGVGARNTGAARLWLTAISTAVRI